MWAQNYGINFFTGYLTAIFVQTRAAMSKLVSLSNGVVAVYRPMLGLGAAKWEPMSKSGVKKIDNRFNCI